MLNQVIVIDGDEITCVYEDDLPFDGKQQMPRASSVEQGLVGEKGWDVVLSDCVVLGEHRGKVIATEVTRRADALEMEKIYLLEKVLAKGDYAHG